MAAPASGSPPRVSVVVPVLDEVRDLGRLLDQLRVQTPPEGGFEVVVSDGGSTDGTVELVRDRAAAWPALLLVPNPGRRSSAGRNAGAARARGEFVIFLDGHCALPRADYLVRLVELFASTGVDCLCRPQPLVDLAEEGWGRAIAAARHSPLGHKRGSEIYRNDPGYADPRSAGAAYRRDLLRRLGGYDERFDACEDVEFNHRVHEEGCRAYHHPDLAVHYRPRGTLAGLWQQMLRYGRGRAHLFARHPSTAPWSLLALSGAALLWILLPVLAGPARGAAAMAILLALWLGALLFEGRRWARPRSDSLRVAMALGAIHLGLLIGFWRGLPEFARFRGISKAAGHV